MSEIVPTAVWYDPLHMIDDPYPLYKILRDQHPVYHNAERGFWALSRYADVQSASRDWHTFSSAHGVDLDDTGAALFIPGSMVDADPPLHDRLRAILHRDFRPAEIKAVLGPRVRHKTVTLLEALAGRVSADLAQDLAFPLPAAIICGWLGFPEDDHPQLMEWFNRMVRRTPGATTIPAAARAARTAMAAYLEAALAQRRSAARADLLSTLERAERDGLMMREEVIGMCIHLFFAGINTTVGLLGTSFHLLARDRELRRLLATEPQRIPAAVEEFLRVDAPIQWLVRWTTRAIALHDQVIPAGERVLLLWGSANRDERRWSNPEQVDLTREPQRHLAFGEGIHHCLGAPLARLEAQIALEELLARFPAFELNGPVMPLFTPGERMLERVPVSL